VFNRISHRNGGWGIDGGESDLDAIRATITDEMRMDFRIFDPDETEPS
jgi:hypothetical protein